MKQNFIILLDNYYNETKKNDKQRTIIFVWIYIIIYIRTIYKKAIFIKTKSPRILRYKITV